MYSRRKFSRLALASLPLSAALGKINSTIKGVQLGVCTYSFRSLPRTGPDDVDTVIQALTECRAGQCELFSPQLEPGSSLSERIPQEERSKRREAVRQWRLTAPVKHFKDIRKRFDTAGIDIYAYTLNFDKSYTDEELEKCFEQTKAMGVKTIASSTKVSMLPRLQPLAEKHKIYVAVHGHSDTKHPDEFSSPETFQKALDMSDWFRVNLDIGHFSAAGFDPVAYINEHHDRITHLHIKDRKKDDGPNEPFGEGNTPIKQVLQLLRDKKYAIPAFVEYEYKGTGTPVEEVNKCLAYMKNALA
ncbi:MAG: sugar phosphate isomerase/epimerase [Acidobacteriaceae bacterium]|nr:sugar phosphate isomerase/epimerase [Acidobacteriaceae bacterium]